jgi:putative phage-type endonuclease
MKIHDVIQGSDEWFAVRAGKFTASNFNKLFVNGKTYDDAIDAVVFGRLTGQIPESFSNEWMQRGVEMEDEAIMIYEMECRKTVTKIGFVEQDEWVGCSPDGLIDDGGMVQIKCPKWNTHLKYMRDPNKLIDEYSFQIQGEMMVCDTEFSDVVSYHPKLPLIVERVKRDDIIIDSIKRQILLAQNEVARRIYELKKGNLWTS